MRSEIKNSLHPAFPDGQPVKVGRKFILVPGGDRIDPGSRIPIRLSKGRAFGSGLHETTTSCIEAIEGLIPLENGSVLDVGTGTGILSLAALLLGASSAVAFDIDGDAVKTCRRNAVINQVEGRMGVFQGTLDALDPSQVFDLVLANIHGDIILREAHRLTQQTREGGYLVLSGMDYGDNSPCRAEMVKRGLAEVSVLFLEDFVTQVWRRPPGQDRKGP